MWDQWEYIIKGLVRFAKVEQVELVDEKLQIVPVNSWKSTNPWKEGNEFLSCRFQIWICVIVYISLSKENNFSEKFSQTIDQIMTSGYSNLTFVIGGKLLSVSWSEKEEIY